MGLGLLRVGVGILFYCTLIDQIAGQNALLEVRSSDAGKIVKRSICGSYNSRYQKINSSLDDVSFHPMVDITPSKGCNADDYQESVENSMVAVARGNCTFIRKGTLAEAFNGSAVLIVNDKGSSRLTIPGGNKSAFDTVNIPIVMIGYQDFQSLHELPGSVRVGLYAPPLPSWDYNMIVIALISVFLVMAAAGWAAYEEYAFRKGSRRTPESGDKNHNKNGKPKSNMIRQEDISLLGVAIWFLLICGVILLLYFFYKYLVYVFIAIFCIISSYSLYQCILPTWSRLLPIMYDIPINRLPCFSTKIKLRSFLLLMPCLTLGIFWAVERHSHYAWILQNILGAAFCIFFIQSLRLPNLKILAGLLILLLVYDVFFVFITPLFTSDGKSVMETVATGGPGGSNEKLPMVFLIPFLGSSPLYACQERQYSLIGFGDIIIPGLLVAYNAVFDVKTGTRMIYYLVTSAAYMVGMAACMISLTFMETGQPALLYLVPATLISTGVLAIIRGELRMLFYGLHWKETKEDVTEDLEAQNRVADDDDANNSSQEEERRNLIQ